MSETTSTTAATTTPAASTPDYSVTATPLPTEGATLADIVAAVNGLKVAVAGAGLSSAQVAALNELTAFLG